MSRGVKDWSPRKKDVDLEMTCRWCPLQYEGTVDGNPAYFRARGSHWSFTIAKPGSTAVLPRPDDVLYDRCEEWGTWPEAGYMEEATAMEFVRRCVEEFRAGKKGSG